MWHDLIVALCLVMVIEGAMPFLNPQSWRNMIFKVVQLNDRSLRIMGFVSMLIGVGMLYVVNR
jgi:uncharacterized protein YjeT (DUF2065 family)